MAPLTIQNVKFRIFKHKTNAIKSSARNQISKKYSLYYLSGNIIPRKFYIRRNNNKVDPIETGHIVIAKMI